MNEGLNRIFGKTIRLNKFSRFLLQIGIENIYWFHMDQHTLYIYNISFYNK